MGQFQITIKKDELEKYGGANVALMNNTNGLESGGDNFGFNSSVRITVTWEPDSGFTGIGWGYLENYSEADRNERLETAKTNPAVAEAIYNGIVNEATNPDAYEMITNGCIISLETNV